MNNLPQPVEEFEADSGITKDDLIGDLLEALPEVEPILAKYIGGGCMDCPGRAFETIEMGVLGHGRKTQKELAELMAEIAKLEQQKYGSTVTA